MKTDLEKSKDNVRERSGGFLSDSSAEEVITPRKRESDTQRKRTERNRTAAARNKQDRDRKILIIGAVSILLVVILIFSAGKSWQRRVDKKEITRLNQSNADLQTQIQDLQKSNSDLQATISSLKTPQTTTTTSSADSSANGTTHVLQTGYNFRAEANTDSDIVMELEEGTSVTIIKVLSDGWVQAEYEGETGYLKCGDELSSKSSSGTASGSTSSEEDNSEEDEEA